MECPKCGAQQSVGREECSACGIIFARWQPGQVRRPTLPSTPVAPPAEKSGGIPTMFIVIGLVFVVIVGLIWTKHHQATKKELSADDMLNEINNKGANLRRQLREEQAAIVRAQSRAAMTAAAIKAKLPPDLDESKIADMIQQCTFFQERVSVDVPRQFQGAAYRSLLYQYPAMSPAIGEHLIEFDPPSFSGPDSSYVPVTVKVTPAAYSKVDVSEDPTVIHFGLGRRRVEISRAIAISESSVSASFTWKFDQNAAASIAPDGAGDHNGGADLHRTGDGWTIQRIWQNSRRSTTNLGCQ